MRKVIFDMDLTLVDTSYLEEARHKRDWEEAYRLIPQTKMYEGIPEVLDIIRKHNIETTVVSTSPRPYIGRLIAFYDIPIKYIDGYHDVKPHTVPILKNVELTIFKQAPNHMIIKGKIFYLF